MTLVVVAIFVVVIMLWLSLVYIYNSDISTYSVPTVVLTRVRPRSSVSVSYPGPTCHCHTQGQRCSGLLRGRTKLHCSRHIGTAVDASVNYSQPGSVPRKSMLHLTLYFRDVFVDIYGCAGDHLVRPLVSW